LYGCVRTAHFKESSFDTAPELEEGHDDEHHDDDDEDEDDE
jgi:hypothetical protein